MISADVPFQCMAGCGQGVSWKLSLFPGLIAQMCVTFFSLVFPVSNLELQPSLLQFGDLGVRIDGEPLALNQVLNVVELFLLLNLRITVLDRKRGLYLGLFLPSAP